jgi:AhpD family alkylhydroperoxidase
MSESQVELNENRKKNLGQFAELLPEVFKKVRSQATEVYRDGALSAKVKRLMAMAIALGAGCRNCILGQTMYALETGATKEEILEVISVVVSMRGTTGADLKSEIRADIIFTPNLFSSRSLFRTSFGFRGSEV